MPRLCPSCGAVSARPGWRCDRCAVEPEWIDDFPAFAPSLARENRGFRRESFEHLARLEERHFWFRARNQLVIWAIRRSAETPTRLLEIGCGTGVVLSTLRKEFPDAALFGSDIHTAGLRFASQRVPDAVLFQMDATKIPFMEEFDVIAACDVIEHIDRDDEALAQMHHALRPGGTLVITVPQHGRLWSAADDYALHKRRYERKELLEKLGAAGFTMILCRSFNALLYPLLRWSRARQRSCHGYDPTGELKISRIANLALSSAMRLERMLLEKGMDFRRGGSLLLVARRDR